MLPMPASAQTTLVRQIVYVRPTDPGATYGDEDGTSYTNAINGLENVTWAPGNTYKIAGFHLPVMTSFNTGTYRVNLTSGTSANHIKIRGDATEEAGKVMGGHIPAYATWNDEGDGVWSMTLPGNFQGTRTWYFQGPTLTDEGTLLEKVATLQDCRDTPGSHYSALYSSDALYIHLTSGNQPVNTVGHADSLVLFPFGHHIHYKPGPVNCIDMINLEFQGSFFDFDGGQAAGVFTAPNYCTWHGGSYKYDAGDIFSLQQKCTGNIWSELELAYAGNGVYFRNSEQHPDEGTWTNMSILNCNIHHMGILEKGNGKTDTDGHAVGVQGGDGLVIDNITTSDTGPAIVFFAHRNTGESYQQTMKNMTVQNSNISAVHNLAENWTDNTIHAIGVSGEAHHLGDKSGILLDNNIIDMGGIGTCIRTQSEDQVVIQNNTLKNARFGIGTSRAYDEAPGGAGNEYATNFKSHDNIFQNISVRFISISGNNAAQDPGMILDSDNNTFELAGGQSESDSLFNWAPDGVRTFAQWKAISKGSNVYDPNSTMTGP